MYPIEVEVSGAHCGCYLERSAGMMKRFLEEAGAVGGLTCFQTMDNNVCLGIGVKLKWMKLNDGHRCVNDYAYFLL